MIFPKKILVMFLLLVIAGALVYFLGVKQGLFKTKEDVTESVAEDPVAATDTPLPVKVKNMQRGDLVIKLKSPGVAVTDQIVAISTEVGGKVRSVHIVEGQSVEKGDLLVELDDREYQLEVERAEASRLQILSELMLENQFAEKNTTDSAAFIKQIEEEKRTYESVYQRYHQGLASEEEFERAFKQFEMKMIESGQKKDEIMAATKGLTQQEIILKKARLNLEKTRITAPFSGIVTEIKVTEQQQVTASFELFTIVNTHRVSVHARVLESEIGKMKVGQEVDLFFSAFPEEVIKGRVKVVSPLVNSDDKTCKVIISLNPTGLDIKPGMHSEVEIESQIFMDRLLVPLEAIVVRSGRKMVFVVNGEIATRRYIETGQENEHFAEVLETGSVESGLKEGDRVIVEGHYTLADHARVRILEN